MEAQNAQNALIGHPAVPTIAEVDAALGAAAPLWHEFVEWAHQHGAEGEEWKCTSPKHGWSLRLQHKKRNIVYLTPCADCVRIAFTFSDRAMQTARRSKLPKPILDALEKAPRYPEGTGLRLVLRKHSDLPAIERLAEIKMAN
jgi:hypothetical protein